MSFELFNLTCHTWHDHFDNLDMLAMHKKLENVTLVGFKMLKLRRYGLVGELYEVGVINVFVDRLQLRR